MNDLVMTAVRAVGVYLLILVVIRLLGKRTIGNFTAFDLLVALMLGEVVDEMIYGAVTFVQGVVAIATVALAQYGNSWLTYWGHGLDNILEGSPTVIVKDGRLSHSGMRAERMNEKEVMETLRLSGVDDVREVELAVVENDGEVSVIKHEWARSLQKADLGGEWERERREAISRRTSPGSGKTTSAGALGVKA